MINVNVFDINDPRRATLVAKAEKQAKAYYELMGGHCAVLGNEWDPWNVIGISWQLYNAYKSIGMTDEDIKQIRACVKHY